MRKLLIILTFVYAHIFVYAQEGDVLSPDAFEPYIETDMPLAFPFRQISSDSVKLIAEESIIDTKEFEGVRIDTALLVCNGNELHVIVKIDTAYMISEQPIKTGDYTFAFKTNLIGPKHNYDLLIAAGKPVKNGYKEYVADDTYWLVNVHDGYIFVLKDWPRVVLMTTGW